MFRKFALQPQKEDSRDYQFENIVPSDKLPIQLNLQSKMPSALDQGHLGSCTANAANVYMQYLYLQAGLPALFPSRLFIYYNSRVFVSKESPHEDCGTTLRDTCKAIATFNICDESNWNYDVYKFNVRPPQNVYNIARQNPKIEYRAVKQDLVSIKSALYLGYPIIFGLAIFTTFKSEFVSHTCQIPTPQTIYENCFGGHSLLLVGYDDECQQFTAMNTWGSKWGDFGFCKLSYEYVLNENLAGDFWTMQLLLDK